MPRRTDEFYDELGEIDYVDMNERENFLQYVLDKDLFNEFREDPELIYEKYYVDRLEEDIADKLIYSENVKNKADAIRDFLEMGCSFTGDKEVVYEENDDYVIFSSPHCFRKLIEYSQINYPKYVKCQFVKKEYTTNTKQYNKYLSLHKRVVNIENGVYKTCNSKRYGNTVKTLPYVLLCKLNNNNCHCVLIKKEGDFNIKLQFSEHNILLKTEDEDQYIMKDTVFKNPLNSIVIYDIEASNEIGHYHEPIITGAYKLNFDEEFNESCVKDYKEFSSDNCYDEFLDWFANSDCDQMFAHNAGGYDNYYLLQSKAVKILNDVFISGKFKCIDFKIRDNPKVFKAKDSLSFISLKLSEANKATANKYFYKQEFDCSLITKDMKNDKVFKEYLKNDVMSLAETLYTFEKWMRKINLSVTTSMGIPGASMKFFQNKYYHSCLFIPRSNSIRLFQRQSVYGGRVFHHKKYSEEPLICLDCNSLYPYALTYDYPIGKFTINIERELTEEFVLKYMGIYEVTLDAQNTLYPIVPYKENLKSLVTYPCNEFKGVYTTIDIKSALAAGYKIVKIHQGIHWKNKGCLFKEFVEYLYNERKNLKSNKNPAEVVYKLLLNSFFGKFLENINNISTYKDPGFDCRIKTNLKNGQTRYSYKVFPAMQRPSYIGSFVLSYSRAIMNKLFEYIHPKDIYYGDTDSVYIPKRIASLIKESNEIGDFKNDYGDNIIIEDAIFADYKRYWLKFNNGNNEIKFNGLMQGETSKILEDKEMFLKMIIGEKTIMQNKWSRNTSNGIKIDPKALRFLVNPCNRRNYNEEENKFYPLDYKYDTKEREFNYNNYELSRTEIVNKFLKTPKKIKMKFPLKSDEDIIVKNPISNLVITNKGLARYDEGEKVMLINKEGIYKICNKDDLLFEDYVISIKVPVPEIFSKELKNIIMTLIPQGCNIIQNQ